MLGLDVRKLDFRHPTGCNCCTPGAFEATLCDMSIVALDMALAVRRPIAINKHPMFSYLMDCVPSICVEDSSISEILRNGLSPLVPAYERNSHERVLSEVEEALSELFL